MDIKDVLVIIIVIAAVAVVVNGVAVAIVFPIVVVNVRLQIGKMSIKYNANHYQCLNHSYQSPLSSTVSNRINLAVS